MSTFKKFPKIHRLNKEEVEGILIGTCHVQEKLDGANTSIWLDKRGEITCASRNRELTEGFNGFVDYVKENEAINKLLKDYPTFRLYGEWLVRHTIQYNETAYKKFYLYDITECKDGEEQEDFLDTIDVKLLADNYCISRPEYLGEFVNPTVEQLNELVGKSTLGDKGEGVVIKNPEFRDKWGNHNYAKIVTESFIEDAATTFGGNNKHATTYWEIYVVNKYITLGRVQKAMHKMQPEIEERLDMKHIPRICGTVYHDMITEEAWEIAKKVHTLQFKELQRIAYKKIKQVYVDILNDSISVADKEDE